MIETFVPVWLLSSPIFYMYCVDLQCSALPLRIYIDFRFTVYDKCIDNGPTESYIGPTCKKANSCRPTESIVQTILQQLILYWIRILLI